MKKIFYSVLFAAIGAFAISSCEDVPEPYTTPSTGGESTDTTTVTPVVGKGTKDEPLKVSEVLSIYSAGDTISGVWAKGFIVAYIPDKTLSEASFSTDGAVATNILIAESADETDYSKCLVVQLPTGDVRTAVNLKDNAGNYKAEVTLYGDILKYFGAAGMKNTTKYILGDKTNVTDGENTDTPDTPVGPMVGEGTADSPYNVASANSLCASLQKSSTSATYLSNEVYVKGIISKIESVDTGNYGNATYYISDDGTEANQLEVYRGYSLAGKKFTSADEIAVGKTVVVCGQLQNWLGTYEFTKSSKIISIE